MIRKTRASVCALLIALAMTVSTPLEGQRGKAGTTYPKASGWNVFSRDQEVQIGKEAAAEAEKKLPVLSESHEITRYVRRLGQQLAANAPEPRYPYTFKVVNQKEINAFALPGGPVYINMGVIQAADSEAELAGVIGHEIGHVIQRHATENATKQMAASAPLSILGGMLGEGLGGQLAKLGISFGAQSVFLKYGRDAEREADVVGARLMHDAGFDPQAMATFFQKLERQGGRRGPEFLSSHPNPGNRARNVSKAIEDLPQKSYHGSSGEFARMKGLAANERPASASK
jgi:predicted Zn-dependent protease